MGKQITVLVANTIYDLKQKFGETRITADTIHIVVKEVIELVEKFVISGSEKKKHVIVILKTLVEDLVDDENEKRIITEMIDKKNIRKYNRFNYISNKRTTRY